VSPTTGAFEEMRARLELVVRRGCRPEERAWVSRLAHLGVEVAASGWRYVEAAIKSLLASPL